jgi:hypothetical protein
MFALLAESVFSASTSRLFAPLLEPRIGKGHIDAIVFVCHNMSPLVPITIGGAQEKLGSCIPQFARATKALRQFIAALV